MENNLMVFEEQQVEVFELNGIVYFNPYHVGNCLGLTESSIRMAICKMNKNQVSKLKNSDVKDIDIRKLNNAGENFLTESGVYKLAFKSHKPNAEKFSDWVTDEVLPSIRKTGFYSTEKAEQLKIQEPYKLVKKFYNGNPVMVLKDLEFLIGTSVHTIGYS
jgi:prophage antirepressor-like protein